MRRNEESGWVRQEEEREVKGRSGREGWKREREGQAGKEYAKEQKITEKTKEGVVEARMWKGKQQTTTVEVPKVNTVLI